MANGERSELITLVEVAFSAKDAKDKYGMKIGDHKLICSVLDAHMKVIKEDTDKQNEIFREIMIKDVVEVITNELRPLNASLKHIQNELGHLRTDMTGLRGQVVELKHKQESIEKEVNKINKRTALPVVYVRLAITAIITATILYFLIRYAHFNWWLAYIQ